ncbi:MAG: hypothetical protein HYV09_09050 [Deltaproteobacteria bacterium]|nr:hypothetical protein [Deltaproteobacteria bacterium]
MFDPASFSGVFAGTTLLEALDAVLASNNEDAIRSLARSLQADNTGYCPLS